MLSYVGYCAMYFYVLVKYLTVNYNVVLCFMFYVCALYIRKKKNTMFLCCVAQVI